MQHHDHPIGTLDIVASHIAIRGASSLHTLRHAPKYGAQTRQVLRAILGEEECGTLLRSGVAACAWSRDYLPFAAPCEGCRVRGRKRFVLPCGHVLCGLCAFSQECPRCGEAHDVLHLRDLRQRVAAWRTAYTAWRRGHAHGACDMEALHRHRPPLRRMHSV